MVVNVHGPKAGPPHGITKMLKGNNGKKTQGKRKGGNGSTKVTGANAVPLGKNKKVAKRISFSKDDVLKGDYKDKLAANNASMLQNRIATATDQGKFA